ncbi:hypothetical protein ACO1O0_003893 [Amphichorda felina]
MEACGCDVPQCGDPWGCANITADNALQKFPELHVAPAPEPDQRDVKEWKKWHQGYLEWSRVKCPCGNGYFCRVHGEWNSGGAVVAGLVPPQDRQHEGYCMDWHYDDQEEGEEESAEPEKGSSSHRKHASSSSREERRSKSKGTSREESKGKSRKESKSRGERSSTGKSREHRSSKHDEHRSSKSDKSSSREDRKSSKSKEHRQPSYRSGASTSTRDLPEEYHEPSYTHTQPGGHEQQEQEYGHEEAYDSTSRWDPRTTGPSGYQQEYDTVIHQVTQGVSGMSMGQPDSTTTDSRGGGHGYDTGHYPEAQAQYTASHTPRATTNQHQYPEQYSAEYSYVQPADESVQYDHQYDPQYDPQYGPQYGAEHSAHWDAQYTYQGGPEVNPEEHYGYPGQQEGADPAAAKEHARKKSKSHSSKKEGKRRKD